MGRIGPSFRQLNEIENLVWSEFKKEFKVKTYKKAFGSLLDSTKLNSTYLSFANSPIHLEYIMRRMMLQRYKTLVDLSKINGELSVGNGIVTSLVYKP